MRILKSLLPITVVALALSGCGSADIISTPIENIDSTPLKEKELSEQELNTWGHLDLVKDTIPGMSVDKAYSEIIKDKKGKTVIVAVIDSGIDIEHEDLNDVVWTNEDEIPNNGIDDDKNGYVDDVYGWNFLGEAYNEQLEMTRIVAIGPSAPDYESAKNDFDADYQQTMSRKQYYEQLYTKFNDAHQTLSNHFGKEDYTKEEVSAINSEDENLQEAIQTANLIYQNGMTSLAEGVEQIKGGVDYFADKLNYNLNVEFKGRTSNDNIDDLTDVGYGNGNVMPSEKDESHGTHVAGIIAAERNNGIGVNGVANNVKIMSIRAIPNGDEYDKDIALAIRYAVDNGAKVINGSFGKDFSPHSDWVRDAIAYAGINDVVFVHAAGNDSKNIDIESNFPDDNVDNGPEVSNTYITVGALAPDYGSDMVAGFSNYGKNNVDIFAPGAKIYSTTPENEYKTFGGTSMASPAVAGIAALIRSYYPKLSAAQVKQAILSSGLSISSKVVVGGDANNVKSFSELSKTGKIANAYNALIMASRLAK